jgi:hypothetical protein
MFLVVRYAASFRRIPVQQAIRNESATKEVESTAEAPLVEDLRESTARVEPSPSTVVATTVRLDLTAPIAATAFVREDTPITEMTMTQHDIEIELGQRENSPDALEVDEPNIQFTRLQSTSPPPIYATQREEAHYREGEAIQETWNELVGSLYRSSIRSRLALRHDQERMRNIVAQLQQMLSTWPEAIGTRQPGAAQRH